MKDTKAILDQVEILNERYGDAHETFKHLRRFWQGHIWQDEYSMTRSLVSVFRDLRHGGAESDTEPDVRVTLPLIEAVVAKFMAQLAYVPQIGMLRPPIGYAGLRKDETCRALADDNERFLYGLWEQNRVSKHFNRLAWYLPLMGSCFHGLQPDFRTKTVKFLTRSPEWAYPVWDSSFEYIQQMIFRWEIPQDQAIQTYGDGVVAFLDTSGGANGQGGRIRGRIGFGSRSPARNNVPIIEYWDQDSKTVLVGTGNQAQVLTQVQHNLGFCPWVQSAFYDVPDEPFAKGVIEGNVAMFQKLNMLDSLELQAIIENVFARMVIINPAVAPADIDNGPGGIIPVGVGGDVKWITPPATTTDLSASMARSMDFVQRGTHLPGSMYGEGVASSITTGKAQHESMMPTGSMIDYVQGNIGDAWEQLNEMAVDMTEKVFANRSVVYFGRQYTKEGIFSRPVQFQQTIKGSDLKGWARHELTFEPLLNLHEKIVMNLQMAGAGLVSKRWQRDQVGIVDNDAMQEEIVGEMLLEGKLAAIMGAATQGQITPQQVEQWFYATEKGGTAADPLAALGGGAPGMPPGMPGMPPGAPPGPPPPASGDMTLPNAQNPGTAGQFPGIPTPPPAQPKGKFTLSGAVGDFSRIKKLKGQVWLVGQLVQTGAADTVECAITQPIDKQTILNGLPDVYHGEVTFHVVTQIPSEPHVEVGPNVKVQGKQAGGPVSDHPNTLMAQNPNSIEFDQQPAFPQGKRNPPIASNYPVGGLVGSIRS